MEADEKPPDDIPDWNQSDLHALFQTAHHDLWWAKGQLWTAANWTLVLLTAVVGVGQLLYPNAATDLSTTWPLALLIAAIAFSSAWYLSRLQGDIVRARSEITFLRGKSRGLDTLPSALPTAGGSAPDRTRGISFVIALLAVVAVAFGLALIVLTQRAVYGVVAFIVQLVVGWLMLYGAITADAA